MSKPVHAEIEYAIQSGEYTGSNCHSDICPPDHDFSKINEEYRRFLHECLDEWLNNSNGTGMFYIAKEGYLREQVQQEVTCS